jgi:hypothetical protein
MFGIFVIHHAASPGRIRYHRGSFVWTLSTIALLSNPLTTTCVFYNTEQQQLRKIWFFHYYFFVLGGDFNIKNNLDLPGRSLELNWYVHCEIPAKLNFKYLYIETNISHSWCVMKINRLLIQAWTNSYQNRCNVLQIMTRDLNCRCLRLLSKDFKKRQLERKHFFHTGS